MEIGRGRDLQASVDRHLHRRAFQSPMEIGRGRDLSFEWYLLVWRDCRFQSPMEIGRGRDFLARQEKRGVRQSVSVSDGDWKRSRPLLNDVWRAADKVVFQSPMEIGRGRDRRPSHPYRGRQQRVSVSDGDWKRSRRAGVNRWQMGPRGRFQSPMEIGRGRDRPKSLSARTLSSRWVSVSDGDWKRSRLPLRRTLSRHL